MAKLICELSSSLLNTCFMYYMICILVQYLCRLFPYMRSITRLVKLKKSYLT